MAGSLASTSYHIISSSNTMATRSRPPRPARGVGGNDEADENGDGGAASSSLQMHNVGSLSSRSARMVGMPEDTPLLHRPSASAPQLDERSATSAAPFAPWILSNLSNRLIPGDTELIDDDDSCASGASSIGDSADDHEAEADTYKYSNGRRSHSFSRSPKAKHMRRVRSTPQRRIFLFLTEPQTSIASFIFFAILVLAITFSCILMMLQTMSSFQFKPDDCIICGGTNEFYSDNDDAVYSGPPLPDLENLPVDCECPPIPLPWTVLLEDMIIWFFTVEWTLRVLCYEPPDSGGDHWHSPRTMLKQKISYCLEWTTVLDALAIFPYYIERYEETNGLLSLRLLRLFRVFQLLRLGKYNTTFLSLMNVLVESLLSFNILLIVLIFGAAFFGSCIYWLEKGTWKYTTYTDPPSFAYMRIGADGETEEPTPFTSIPAAFWWFIVTATTVGYGDAYPTTFGGKCVAAMAMLMGLLVIAFPVSVFSDLWSKELKRQGVLNELQSQQLPRNTESEGDILRQGAPANSGQVLVSETDLNTIILQMRQIDKAQNEIRQILANYSNQPMD